MLPRLLDEDADEETLRAVEVGDGLGVVAAEPGAGQSSRRPKLILPARALYWWRAAAGAERGVLADEDAQEGIEAERVVVVEVLVAEAEGEDALAENVAEGVRDVCGIAVVDEVAGELLEEAEAGVDLAEEDSAGVGDDGSASKSATMRLPRGRSRSLVLRRISTTALLDLYLGMQQGSSARLICSRLKVVCRFVV